MMRYSVDQLIREADKLPPIPQAAQKALALIRSPESSASALARVIEMDQVLTTQVLRWANSAYYGMENRISTAQQAIVVLGLEIIQELIMTYSFSDRLYKPLPGYELQRGELWQHALGTAIGAKLISKQLHLKIDEDAYFAGLLCDVGKLVFEKLLRESEINRSEWAQHSFLELERNSFGIDHAMLGAEIARRWQLPENLVTAIAHHHEPQSAENHALLVATVHVADVSMMILGVGIGIDGLQYPLEDEALKRLGMTWEDLFHLIEQVSEQLAKAKEMISLT
ncbi:MAG: HDOD domain-containing protein [Chloroflexi bacterium]|nr:HDOD domain-containing protein [Chloroflexota bacterium]